MSHTFLPIHIKAELIPFLFKKLKYVECDVDGARVKAVKVSTHTAIGKFIRLLVERTDTRQICDKSPQIILRLEESTKIKGILGCSFKYEDLRSSFCSLPEAGQELLNEYLEEQMQTALMNYVNSWHEKKGAEGIEVGIAMFFEKYNLEEYGYSIQSVRRDYYRKLNDGYFKAMVEFDPLKKKII